MRGSLPPINMPKAFGGDGGGADGGRRRADEDEAALAERMSPRSIMSDEVRPALHPRGSSATWRQLRCTLLVDMDSRDAWNGRVCGTEARGCLLLHGPTAYGHLQHSMHMGVNNVHV